MMARKVEGLLLSGLALGGRSGVGAHAEAAGMCGSKNTSKETFFIHELMRREENEEKLRYSPPQLCPCAHVFLAPARLSSPYAAFRSA